MTLRNKLLRPLSPTQLLIILYLISFPYTAQYFMQIAHVSERTRLHYNVACHLPNCPALHPSRLQPHYSLPPESQISYEAVLVSISSIA